MLLLPTKNCDNNKTQLFIYLQNNKSSKLKLWEGTAGSEEKI